MMKALLFAIAVMAIVRPENLSSVASMFLMGAGLVILAYFAFQGTKAPGNAVRSIFEHPHPRNLPPE